VNLLDHFRRFGWPRRALFALGLLFVLAIVVRVVLDPIAAHSTRKALNESEAMSGDFQSVHVTVHLWPTVLGVVRNALVEGISAGFAQRRPPAASNKETVLTQTTHNLQKDEGPPKAQPPKTAPRSGRK
jgi:hypothetical protein